MKSNVRSISSSFVAAANPQQPNQRIELTPWDLQLLAVGSIQKGLLFHRPNQPHDMLDLVLHLKSSLSHTLHFFPPLAGRFATQAHHDDTTTFFIDCNNAGALFVHAVADGVTVADITQPTLVPPVVQLFFPLNGVKNYQGTRDPLLALQLTELADGIFIGCTLNHSACDGTSLWSFFNSWSEISRGLPQISKSPSFSRWSPAGSDLPFRIPNYLVQQFGDGFAPPPVEERYFHIGRDKIAKLKEKANSEVGTTKISSLQVVLTHFWRCIVRIRKLDPEEETAFKLPVGVRTRLPLPENYFGNAVEIGSLTMKVNELLENGIGNSAWKMSNMVRDYSDEENMVEYFRSWAENPKFYRVGNMIGWKVMCASSSPRFDVYGNDFGWGKPVAVRCGAANKSNGKLTLFCGREEGSMDIELCLEPETLEALASDDEFMEFVTV